MIIEKNGDAPIIHCFCGDTLETYNEAARLLRNGLKNETTYLDKNGRVVDKLDTPILTKTKNNENSKEVHNFKLSFIPFSKSREYREKIKNKSLNS